MKQEQLSEMGERLMSIPKEISNIQLEILEMNATVQNVRIQLSTLEVAIRSLVNNRVDENGKKIYTNADAREAAFIELSQSDIELADIKKQISELQVEIQKKQIQFDFLSNEQKNIRSLLHFFAGVEKMVEI